MTKAPVFIIGTGRCGSTLLSSIINSHPELLSISEFFSFITDLGTTIPKAFPEEAVSAEYFWQLISNCYEKQNLMLRKNIAMKEVLYPWQGGQAKYNAETGVPAILQTALPHLTQDFDLLFEELQDVILQQPEQNIKAHYQFLFKYLMQKFDCNCWVERSGGTLRIVHRLYKMFPNARFVHILRDGRDCAISMSKHYGFRMVMTTFQIIEILGIDPYFDDDRMYLDDLPDELFHLLPERFDANEFRNFDAPMSIYGHYWTGELLAAEATLNQIPNGQLYNIRYEDILENPSGSIRSLMKFLEVDELKEDWLDEISRTIRKPNSNWKDLDDFTKNQLNKACEKGFEMINRQFSELEEIVK